MRVLLAPSSDRKEFWSLQTTDDEGRPVGEPTATRDLAETVRRLEVDRPRWVWPSTARVHAALLRAGVRVDRCHDVAMTEALLRAHEERPAATVSDADPGSSSDNAQTSLFDPEIAPGTDAEARSGPGGEPEAGAEPIDRDEIGRLIAAHTDQLTRIRQARTISPGFGLLVAAESAAALAAVEMGRAGLPWRADIHDRVLTELLGERPRHGGRPPRLQELAVAVAEALEGESRRSGGPRAGGAPGVNVDSPMEVLRAFRRQGVQLETTRAWELKTVDHPAVEPLLRYKELARLHTANGWAWREQWVRDGRFRPEYVVGGVVSGRWATKGGGALQIPRAVRASVVADPGWALVVADAGQLEPRVLAALSGDPGMVAATQAGDLYAALATQALGRPEARDEAKIALLAAMYGARANTPAMAALTRRFPRALDLLEAAARTGEDGGVVRSVLGRTCPPPNPNWQQGPETVLSARSRARGRFTRNFVIQASAADWANTVVAGLRQRLIALEPVGEPGPELVFFQHDEVVVHTPSALVDAVIDAVTTSGEEATRLVVGERGVRIPFTATPVASYADKH